MFDIKLAAVVQFEFYSSTNSDEVKSAFEELYQDPGEEFGGLIFGTNQSWKRTQFTIEEWDTDDLSSFERVTTYLAPDNRHVYDAVTIGYFSPEAIKTIRTAESRTAESEIKAAIEGLDRFTEEIPTIPDDDRTDPPAVFYVEPTEQIDITMGDDSWTNDEIAPWVEAHQDALRQLNILLGHQMSIIGRNDLLSPHHMDAGAIREVTLLNLTSRTNIEQDLTTPPAWLEVIEENLKPYYRSDLWLNHRWQQLGELDEDTHGTAALFSDDPSGLESYQATERELESLREDWLDLYTKASDEVGELISDTPFSGEDEISPRREIPLIPPASNAGTAKSQIEPYESHIKELEELVRSDLDRIGDKLDRLSQFIHDSVVVRSSETNIELQDEIQTLTYFLTLLTVLLGVLAIVDIFITAA